jgi:hypothetical protein
LQEFEEFRMKRRAALLPALEETDPLNSELLQLLNSFVSP